MSDRLDPSPKRVAVLGAGMVGLSTAWYLQEYGIDVTVLDREGVAAGSSWGNAGWLTPSKTVPLPAPGLLKYGVRAMFNPSSPVYVPPTLDPQLLGFLLRFARNCTKKRWQRAMQGLIPFSNDALDAFAEMEHAGLNEQSQAAEPFTAAFRTVEESQALQDEFDHMRAAGLDVSYDVVDGATARLAEPALGEQVGAVVRLNGQRFLNPPAFVGAIADSVRERGGHIVTDVDVTHLPPAGANLVLAGEEYDAVVVATGARLSHLARQVGVRRVVQAGRGYSFTIKIDKVPKGPVFMPAQRVACTPVGDRLRVAGMMEFRDVDAPADPRRIKALVDAAGTLLHGAHFDERQDEWVGARPCTTDGLPLIGATANPRVFVAGGHGMWGITHGPITGKWLAQLIATGHLPAPLRAVDPLR